MFVVVVQSDISERRQPRAYHRKVALAWVCCTTKGAGSHGNIKGMAAGLMCSWCRVICPFGATNHPTHSTAEGRVYHSYTNKRK